MKLVCRLSRYIIVGLLALILSSTAATAQSSNQNSVPEGVSISPPLKEVIIGPGLIEAKTSVTVTNNTGQNLKATIRLVDFDALDEFGGVSLGQIDAPTTAYSLAHWMYSPDGDSVSLPSKRSVTIPISIKNDDDLSPGGHYGAAIVSLLETGQGETGVSLRQELASLIFVKKTGGEKYGLQLEALTAKNLPQLPTEVTMRFKSTGNVHVVPRGYIEVTAPDGTLVSKGIINPESTLVLPDKTRQFITIMQPVADSRAGGRYKITAYYRYDGQEEFSSKTLEFNRGISLKSIVIGGFAVLITGVILAVAMVRIRQKKTAM